MGRKKESTPRSRVKNALRQLWLRSRERAKVIKTYNNTCIKCGKKGSVAKGREVKIQVHHEPQINWDGIVDLIFERLLNTPQFPECEDCHNKEHNSKKQGFYSKDGNTN